MTTRRRAPGCSQTRTLTLPSLPSNSNRIGPPCRLRLEPLHHLRERPLRHHAHLRVGPVLDRVRHVDGGRREAERFRLPLGAVDELLGRDEDRGHAARLEIDDVVHTARRARPSIGERFDDGVAACGDLVAQVGGRGLGEGRLAEAEGGDAAGTQELLEAVEEDVAPRLRDVEEADGPAGERGWAGDSLADRELSLAGRIEEGSLVAVPSHGLISFITGSLPSAPLAQPPIIIEKSPARPPQWTRRSPFGRNLGSVAPARLSGTPSAMPPAPRISSRPGICRSSCSRPRSACFDHPASRTTRACSGPIASRQSKTITSLGWWSVRRFAASVRARDSGPRACRSTT